MKKFMWVGVAAIAICVTALPAVSTGQPSARSKADSDWTEIVRSEDGKMIVLARRNSFEVTHNEAGSPIGTITVRIARIGQTQVEYVKYYVTKADCLSGAGKVVAMNPDGARLFDNEFVLNGYSLASNIATVICEQYLQKLGKRGRRRS